MEGFSGTYQSFFQILKLVVFDLDSWPWPCCDLVKRCLLFFSITVVSFIKKIYKFFLCLLRFLVFDLDRCHWPWEWSSRKIHLFFPHHCAKFHTQILIHSLFIWIHSLTLTFDLDLNNDLVERCLSYLSIITLSFHYNAFTHSFSMNFYMFRMT